MPNLNELNKFSTPRHRLITYSSVFNLITLLVVGISGRVSCFYFAVSIQN